MLLDPASYCFHVFGPSALRKYKYRYTVFPMPYGHHLMRTFHSFFLSDKDTTAHRRSIDRQQEEAENSSALRSSAASALFHQHHHHPHHKTFFVSFHNTHYTTYRFLSESLRREISFKHWMTSQASYL